MCLVQLYHGQLSSHKQKPSGTPSKLHRNFIRDSGRLP
jgi:hypothetical protein